MTLEIQNRSKIIGSKSFLLILSTLTSPPAFIILLLLTNTIYFFDCYYWWPILLSLQLGLCGIGLFISSWRVVAIFFLIILVIFNTAWLRTPRMLPSNCHEEIVLQGYVKTDSYNSKQIIDFISCKVWCKGKLTKKAITRLYLTSDDIKLKKKFQPGDLIELKRFRIIEEESIGLRIESSYGFRYYNLTAQERILNRNQFLNFIQSKARYYLDSFSLSILKSLLTADRSSLESNWSYSFKLLGIVHIFAVSGMHIGILYLWFVFVFRRIISLPMALIHKGYGILTSDLIGLLLIVLFLNMIGMPISAKRSVTMLFWWLTIKHLVTWQPLWFVLSGTAIVILTEMPMTIGQVSFQLSFLSVFGIITILPVLPQRKNSDSFLNSILKYFLSMFIISCWLMLLTLPITQNLVENQSLLSPLNNIIHITFISFIYIPLLIVVLMYNLIGFYGRFTEGEFYLYSIVNFCTRIWEEILTINVNINSHFLFRLPFQWSKSSTIFYWSILCSFLRFLILMNSNHKLKHSTQLLE